MTLTIAVPTIGRPSLVDTLESIARRQADYRSLADEVEHFAIVDANRPIEAVIDNVVEEIVAFAQTPPRRRRRGA